METNPTTTTPPTPDADGPAALYVADLPDLVQVMVTVWPDGSAECAFREETHHMWGPAVPMESRPVR